MCISTAINFVAAVTNYRLSALAIKQLVLSDLLNLRCCYSHEKYSCFCHRINGVKYRRLNCTSLRRDGMQNMIVISGNNNEQGYIGDMQEATAQEDS